MKKRDYSDHSLYPDVTGQIIRVWKIARGGSFFDLAKFLHNRDEIRIVEATDNTTTMKDLKGDLFSPSAHPDMDPKQLEEEEKEFNIRVEREGVTGIIGLIWNRDNEDWDQVDSIWGFVGSDWLESEHDLEILERLVAVAKERGFEGQEDFDLGKEKSIKEVRVKDVSEVVRLMERGHRILMPVEKYLDVEKFLKDSGHKDRLSFWEDEERIGFVRAFLLEGSKKVLGNPEAADEMTRLKKKLVPLEKKYEQLSKKLLAMNRKRVGATRATQSPIEQEMSPLSIQISQLKNDIRLLESRSSFRSVVEKSKKFALAHKEAAKAASRAEEHYKRGLKSAWKLNPSLQAPLKASMNAKRGLLLRQRWGRGGTAVGVARARDLANQKNLSMSTIRRMASFNRHRKNSDPNKRHKDGGPTAGYIAWLLWGGDAGIDWALKKSQAR